MKNVLLFLIVTAIILATVMRVRYGGGVEYVDLTSAPLHASNEVQSVFQYSEPIGNLAVNADGRLFFTVHPEARPQGNKLLEVVDGAAVPFPDSQSQQLFDSVLGVVVAPRAGVRPGRSWSRRSASGARRRLTRMSAVR